MSLQTTVQELKELKPFVDENVEEGPIETLNGRRGRKNNAIEQTENLKRQYLSELLESAVFIVLVGSKRNEFEKLATGEGINLFSTDPETFYRDLASRVDNRVYGNAGQTDIFDILGRHLEDKMIELGLREYNQMVFREQYVQPINNAEQLTNLLKTAINEQIGAEIVAIQAVTSIVDKAIDAGYVANVTPIVLNTNDEKLAINLIRDLPQKRPSFLVIAGETTEYLKRANPVSTQLEEVTKNNVKILINKLKKGK
jgi:hypothetical protein